MPGLDSCTVDGDVRTVGTMGIEVKEQLRDLDDDTRRVTYGIVESPMSNMTSHEVVIAVEAEGDGTHLTWTVTVEPDDLLGIFQGIYDGAVVAMKRQVRELRDTYLTGLTDRFGKCAWGATSGHGVSRSTASATSKSSASAW